MLDNPMQRVGADVDLYSDHRAGFDDSLLLLVLSMNHGSDKEVHLAIAVLVFVCNAREHVAILPLLTVSMKGMLPSS